MKTLPKWLITLTFLLLGEITLDAQEQKKRRHCQPV